MRGGDKGLAGGEEPSPPPDLVGGEAAAGAAGSRRRHSGGRHRDGSKTTDRAMTTSFGGQIFFNKAIVYLTSSSCSLIHVIQFTDLVLVSPDLLAAELPAGGHRLGGSSSSLCCRARRRMCLPQRYRLEVVASLSLGGSDVLPVDVDGGVWCR